MRRGTGDRVRATALFTVALLAGCDSAAKPVPVATVSLTPSAATLIAGSTQQLSATALDDKGNTLANRPVTWSVDKLTVAAVTAGGVVTAIAPGSATVTATSGGRSGAASITVLPVPVASVVVSPPTAEVLVGAAQQLAVELRDASGNVLADRVVVWTSSRTEVASVGASGLVTAVAPGVATISATSEGKQGTAQLTVLAPDAPPVIVSIAPSTLVPGASATITGRSLGSLDSTVVTLGGAAVRLTTASSTQLTFTVPCARSGMLAVRVAVGSRVTEQPHPLATARRALAVGESFIAASSAESECNELATPTAATRYLVAVFSTSTSANALLDFALEGNPPAAGEGAPSVAAPRAMTMPRDAAGEGEHGRDSAHLAMLERERALYEQLSRRPIARMAPGAARSVVLPAVGDMRSAYFTFTGGCSDTTRVIRARALYVGTRSIVWEDSANTLQSAADSALAGYYRRLGLIFDADQYDAVKRHFADPLLRDAQTDADGRVHMIFTQRLNSTGAAAYVTSCDQYPSSSARGSNFGEVFYGFVPTVSGSNLGTTATPDGWFNFMARTVVHEVKHIASMASRVANAAPQLEQSWLEEGTARHAEEVWVRESLHKVPWRGNTGFGTATSNGVYCDFHASDATCTAADTLRRPGYGMRRHFNELREKLVQPWNWSPYGTGNGQSGSVFYQTTWSLVRYAIDRYGASDAAFLSALTNATSNGIANLTAVAGTTMDRLLGGWGMALYADDYPGMTTGNADVQFPTWNLRDIYAGLHASPSWTSRWSTPYPVVPTPLSFGSFTAVQSGLRGGAHAYYELAGPSSGGQVLSLRAPTGGTPSPSVRLAVVRLQ